MKFMKYFLLLLCIFTIKELKASNYNGMNTPTDSLIVHFNDSIIVGEITIKWDTFITEWYVGPNGLFDGMGISLGIMLKGKESEQQWDLTIPVPYNPYIKNNSAVVSYGFEGYNITLINADFENERDAYIVLQILEKVRNNTSYFIDYKQVDEKEFKHLLLTLTEVKGTWFCAETKDGGITGYDMTDKHDNIYKYESESENGVTKITLIRPIQ